MRVLLDEMLPRKLGRELAGHDVSTVPREGWAGLTNGALLDAIDSLFHVFITMDKGMRHQQRMTGRAFGIIELRALSNAIDDLAPLAPRIIEAIDIVRPGEIMTVGVSEDGSDPGVKPSAEREEKE